MNILLALPVIVSFLVTLLFLPVWIRRAHNAGLEGRDIQKMRRNMVAEGGGVTVGSGFLIAVLLYLAIRTFVFQDTSNSMEILAMTTSLLMLAMIGYTDDILGWKMGLTRKMRILLVALAAIPLMAINAGRSEIAIPFNWVVDLGLLYPLVLIPIGIVGATTTYNFLAGFNGLEAGQGILLVAGLSIVAYFTGSSWLALIGLCMIAALAAFLFYNRYPSRVFPGDTLTYAVGGLIAIMAILGNFEKVAAFFFLPYILETALKLRGGLKKESFGVPQKDGTLKLKYDKLYGLTHVAIYLLPKMGIKPTEKNAVYLILAFQLVILIGGIFIFREGIFLA